MRCRTISVVRSCLMGRRCGAVGVCRERESEGQREGRRYPVFVVSLEGGNDWPWNDGDDRLCIAGLCRCDFWLEA